MSSVIVCYSILALLSPARAGDSNPPAGRLPARCEVVMSPGTRITATTPVGTIAITALDELARSYTWDGATRAVEMSPRRARFYGSLGLFHTAQDEHWRDNHGITRGFTEEGQQDFISIDEFKIWINRREWMTFVYRDDGLAVGWNKILGGKKLLVEVWQILIDGKKPKQLPGSNNDKIVVERVDKDWSPLVRAVANVDAKKVTALLSEGADANARNSADLPVLITAIRRDSAPIVQALLEHKADPNVRDIDTDFTPLFEAICTNASEEAKIVKMLLAAGANANAAIRIPEHLLAGYTPLMIASQPGGEAIVRLLIENGADVRVQSLSGDTALDLAKSSGSDEFNDVIQILEAANAKKPR